MLLREQLMRWTFIAAAIFAVVMACLPEPPQLLGDPFNRLLHLLAFAVLTGLASAAFPRARGWQILLGLGALGAAIELVQAIPALSREASLVDWGLDMAAIVAALAVRQVLKLARRRSQ